MSNSVCYTSCAVMLRGRCRYKLAENVDAQLKRMASDLKEIVDHLNATNCNSDSSDPVSSAILCLFHVCYQCFTLRYSVLGSVLKTSISDMYFKFLNVCFVFYF